MEPEENNTEQEEKKSPAIHFYMYELGTVNLVDGVEQNIMDFLFVCSLLKTIACQLYVAPNGKKYNVFIVSEESDIYKELQEIYNEGNENE